MLEITTAFLKIMLCGAKKPFIIEFMTFLVKKINYFRKIIEPFSAGGFIDNYYYL